jgi:hypothetical protein
MLALEFFTWWYGQGWLRRWQGIGYHIHKTTQAFSVPTLLKTLFEPWRRIISYPGAGLNDHVRAMIDNLFSRLVGFCVRVLVMIFAGLMLLFIFLIGVSLALIWPFLPFAVLGLIIKGVF